MESLELQQEEEKIARACKPLNHSKRARLTSCLAQCHLKVDATIAWHSPQTLRKLT